MPSVKVSVDIKAPVEKVWAAASELAGHARWMADVESITFESDSKQGPGTVMIVATKVGPFRTKDVIKVVGWEPLRRITVEHRGLFTGRGEFELSPVGGATRFTWTEDIVFPRRFGGSLGAALARPILARIWRGNLRRLQSVLET